MVPASSEALESVLSSETVEEVEVLLLVEPVLAELLVSLPQAAIDRAMVRTRAAARSFFMMMFPLYLEFCEGQPQQGAFPAGERCSLPSRLYDTESNS